MTLQRWIKIVNEINKDPYSRRRVIFDILNEPDSAVSALPAAVTPAPADCDYSCCCQLRV